MNAEQQRQLVEVAMQEVDMLTVLLQAAQSRLKGLLALQPDDHAPSAPETPEAPSEPSRGARLIEQWQLQQSETFGGDD